MHTVLIAVDSSGLADTLCQALGGQYTVVSCADGVEAVDALCSVRPHLMIVDLMLKEIDGIHVIQAARDLGLRIPTVAISSYISEYILYHLEQMQVGSLLRLPCDPLHIAATMRELELYSREDDREERRIREILGMLGIRLNSLGYRVATEAVRLLLENPALKLTTELYPTVAQQLQGTDTQIEKALRHSVDSAWRQCNQSLWRIYFPVDKKNRVVRPTNAHFLYRITEVILQEREEIKSCGEQYKTG